MGELDSSQQKGVTFPGSHFSKLKASRGRCKADSGDTQSYRA